MDPKQKFYIICTIVLSVTAIGLIVASMSTDAWVKANVRKFRNSSESQNSSSTLSVTNDDIPKFTGIITFGLFKGNRKINFGFGAREASLSVVCAAGSGYCILFNTTSSTTTTPPEGTATSSGQDVINSLIAIHKNSSGSQEDYELGLFNFGLWVSTIIFAALAIVWGLISIGFSIFNVFGKPIETITGPMGLYLWNTIAFFSGMIAVITYAVLFLQYYRNNILIKGDSTLSSYTNKDTTYLEYSFFLMVGAVAAYLLNLILLILSGQKLTFGCGFTKEAEKVIDNGIILY